MKRFGRAMMMALLGWALSGCGAEQAPPPTDLSKLPSDPMGGAVPKKGTLKKGSSMPSLPSMPGSGPR